ncbi:MAG TPA: response regulator [Blastocatellia bacterium]|nr:response regulator [Blastocatellia bacterium]
MGVLSTSEISQMLCSGARVLVIDDDRDIRDVLRVTLEREGYEVMVAATGSEGLHRLIDGEPCDLLLLDVVLPDINGWTILSRVRATPALARVPIIMMTALSNEHSETDLLAAGADDYLPKPFSYEKLLAHVKALLRRSALQSINPLTGLPGNRQVERFLQQCSREAERFWAAAYIDIDNFKAYNDCYGFLQGDEVLKATAETIARAAKYCPHSVFIGNIGGDDFLLGFTGESPRADERCVEEVRGVLADLAEDFDRQVRKFYSEEDATRGYLEAESRRGGIERYPLMSLSIAVVTNSRRLFNHPLEISNTFVSVKRKAKSLPGSVVCFDQRRR